MKIWNLVIAIVMILFSLAVSFDNMCDAFKLYSKELVFENSQCSSSSDCHIYNGISPYCALYGSCVMSLNSPILPYEYNKVIVALFELECEEECRSYCGAIEGATPLCIDGRCDFVPP